MLNKFWKELDKLKREYMRGGWNDDEYDFLSEFENILKKYRPLALASEAGDLHKRGKKKKQNINQSSKMPR